jgi:hypothetical protein
MGDKYAKKYLGIKNGDKVTIKYASGDVTGTIDKIQASADTSGGSQNTYGKIHGVLYSI